MRKPFSSLRARVLLLIAIPFAALFATTIYHTLSMRADRLMDARMHVLDTARVMAGEQQRIIEHIHQVLSSVALLPDVRRGVASEACNHALAARLKQEPTLNNIILTLANGDVICNATTTAKPFSIADVDFFKAAIQTRQFSVGGYVISRTTGRPGMGFVYPVLNDAGVPRIAVGTTLELAWLEQELSKAHFPEGARVGIVDGEGFVLARYPDPEQWVGKRAAEFPLLKSILVNGGEGVEEHTGANGQRRIVGFVPLYRTASGKAHLWVSIPEHAVVGPMEHAFVVNVLVALTLLVLTFGTVWLGSESLFVRRIAALARAAMELGKGNLTARVKFKAGGDEIGQLAQSFDHMADELQAKEVKLSGAVRALRVLSAGNRTMMREKEGEQHLLEQMCRAIGEAGGYRLTWVGYAENDVHKSIRPVARWGSIAEGYFENVKFTWSDTESGCTPPGQAIRTGMPAVVQDIQREAGPQPWQDYAMRSGIGACLALPLRINERVIGVLNICAEETQAFSDEEIKLLSEAADDLSFGIAGLRAALEQTRMARTLKTAEERYKAAAEANLDALFIAKSVRDGTGHIVDFEFTDINAQAEKMLGMSKEKVIGQKLCELIPINRSGGFLDKYAQVVETGKPLEEEFPIDAPELKAKWLRHQAVRVGDGIAIFSRDVTQWKEAGARLEESEERLRLAMAAARMGAWTWDAKSNTFSWSEGIGPVFGLASGKGFNTPREMIEAVHSADRGALVRAASLGREKGVPVRVEFRTIWPDGSLHWAEARSEFMRGTAGTLERGIGIAMDITERKLAEETLRRNQAELSEAQRIAHLGNWQLDLATNHVNWSDELYRMLGLSPERPPPDFTQQSRLFTPESWERLAAAVSQTQKTAIPYELELEMVRADGAHGWMLARGEAMRDASGAVVRLRGVAADITKLKEGELALTRANRALRTLSACSEALIRAVSEPELLNSVCRLVVEAGGYCMACVRFAEQDAAKTVRVVAQYGGDDGYLESGNITWADTEQGRGPTGTAIRTGETQVNQNILTNPNMAPWREAARARGFQSSIALPLKGPAGTYGALTLYARECDAFTEDEVQLLEKLADELAFGITTLRIRVERDRIAYAHQHHEEILRKSLEESIQAISDTVETRDPYTAGHQKRVGQLAIAIAGELGLPKDDIHGINLAASIHDVGKIQVPAEILSKPGKLTGIEFMLIKAHAQAGYDILKGIEFPWPIADIVLQHHERIDGSGYPQGLKADEILLGAKIITVADVVEAMASHRPYRPALGIDVALAEIERGRGSAFDPVVVDACLKLFRERRFAFQT